MILSYVQFVALSFVIVSTQDGSVQITWDKPSELEEYIGKLQAAAERLTTENRRLRHCHTILVDKVPITSILDQSFKLCY